MHLNVTFLRFLFPYCDIMRAAKSLRALPPLAVSRYCKLLYLGVGALFSELYISEELDESLKIL